MVNAAETSIIIDSEDFSEEEWKTLMKKRRRNNARKTYDSVSSNEGEKNILYRHHEVLQDYHHRAKKKKGNESNILHLPSLPKPPSISLSPQSHITSNVSPKASTSRTDETQRNLLISKFLLLF